jgi:hypothetical protein
LSIAELAEPDYWSKLTNNQFQEWKADLPDHFAFFIMDLCAVGQILVSLERRVTDAIDGTFKAEYRDKGCDHRAGRCCLFAALGLSRGARRRLSQEGQKYVAQFEDPNFAFDEWRRTTAEEDAAAEAQINANLNTKRSTNTFKIESGKLVMENPNSVRER